VAPRGHQRGRGLDSPLPPVAPRRERALQPLAGPQAEPDEAARQLLERRIAQHVPMGRLALAVTDNAYTMISVKREKGLYRLRLHHMFLDAEPEVVRALGAYVSHNDRAASQLLGRFIDIHQRKIRKQRRGRRRASPPSITIETRGEVHDLQSIFDELNAKYFDNTIDARITWGHRAAPGTKRRHRTSIKMGSYAVEDRLIRIHPSLDRPFVPRVFVSWIVFHEMLHQKHDIPVIEGRRIFHTPEFLAEETTFEQYDEVRAWERANLDRLLYY
jgi:predicted metal-dependent hydrolase